MSETLKLILTKFTDETITLSLVVLLFVFFLLIAIWLYNRKRMHQLRHQIPASVVKNYLDTIIQNSSALKSSLFRGGGQDVGMGIPSVVSLPISGAGGASSEELSARDREISSLKAIIDQKDRLIRELEAKIRELESRAPSGDAASQAKIASLNKKIDELTAQLQDALANANSGSSGASEEVVKERDALKERLAEYEIIEEDLANLKRLQQENARLKKALEGGGGAVAVAAAATLETAEIEETASAPAEADDPAMNVDLDAPAELAATDDPLGVNEASSASDSDVASSGQAEGEQKSAEELLNEFEKMLG